MYDEIKANAMSHSLINKEVCYALLSEFEPATALNCEISEIRKYFYSSGRKKQVLKFSDECFGYPAITNSVIGRKTIKHQKTVNNIKLEQSYKNGKVFIIGKNDFNGNVFCKIYYDDSVAWVKTEYFDLENSFEPTHIIKPAIDNDVVDLYVFDKKKQRYNSLRYYPVQYELNDVKFLEDNDKYGQAPIYLNLPEASFVYCTKEEQVKRLKVKQNESLLEQEFNDEEEKLIFPIPLEDEEEAIIPILLEETDEEEVSLEEKDLVLEVENTKPIDEIEFLYVARGEGEKFGLSKDLKYTGRIIADLAQGNGRLEKETGETVFVGEFKSGKKEGFGNLYSEKGDLKYAGFWHDDQKNGIGVSFREKDKALHVSNWTNGRPDELIHLYDDNGKLKFVGNMKNGKKTGSGIKQVGEKLVVYKYSTDDQNPTIATVFDSLGNMIYNGEYVDGLRQGEGTEFDTNGNIIYKGKFEKDEYANGTFYQQIHK